MSKRVNVNPGQYKVAGRLHADEAARGRQEQARVSPRQEGRKVATGAPRGRAKRGG